MNNEIVASPKIDARILWQMPSDEFNNWRRKHDYPRIFSFFKKKLPEFDKWISDQNLSADFMFEHSLSIFFDSSSELYLYRRGSSQKYFLSKWSVKVSKTDNVDSIEFIRKITPYQEWYKKSTGKVTDIRINRSIGRSRFLFMHLEMLDLGNVTLNARWDIGERLLDFTNLNDLKIINCLSSIELRLWFCSAINLSIEGDLAFLNAYRTKFYSFSNEKISNLKLNNGNFQKWQIQDCEVSFIATNSTIQFWNVRGWDFRGSITNTELLDCDFSHLAVNSPIDFGRVKTLHGHLKNLYSQIGRKKQASNHFFLEKTFERKSFLRVRANYNQQYYSAKGRFGKFLLKSNYFLKYVVSGFMNVLWGYGEKPGRVFFLSIILIFVFAAIYCFHPLSHADTKYNYVNSLYFSLVTFTTLGYGDIGQTNNILKLLSGFEALLGMTFWGILIAGFTSNAKDY